MSLYVARYRQPAPPKHWTFFVEGPTPASYIQHHILGPNARTYFVYDKIVGEHPVDHPQFVQLSYLCDVGVSNIEAIECIAEGMRIYQYRHVWDVQQYVLDLIEVLESARVIEIPPDQFERYQESKRVINGYLEEGQVPPLRGLWDRSLWGRVEEW